MAFPVKSPALMLGGPALAEWPSTVAVGAYGEHATYDFQDEGHMELDAPANLSGWAANHQVRIQSCSF